jgi:hypothetical protein
MIAREGKEIVGPTGALRSRLVRDASDRIAGGDVIPRENVRHLTAKIRGGDFICVEGGCNDD